MPIATPFISKELPGQVGSKKGTAAVEGRWRNEVVNVMSDADDHVAQDIWHRDLSTGRLAYLRQKKRQQPTIGAHRRPLPPATPEFRDSIPPGSETQVRWLARDFLRTGRLPRHGDILSREEATLQYLALRTVEVALRDSDDNKNPHQFLAQMLPLHHAGKGGRQPLSARGLGRQLRSLSGDQQALKSLLGPIYGERALPRELFDLLDDGESRDNDDALVELLAGDHGLPTVAGLRGQRKRLAEQLEDAREDLLHSNEQQIFGSLNAEEASRQADDPKAFKDNYCEFVHGELGFAGTFKKIVELFGSENLRSTLMTLKKALGDDMNQLSAPASYAPEHLAAIHNVVSHLSRLSQINVVLETTLPLLKLMTQAGAPLDERLLIAGISTLFEPGTPTALRFQLLCESLDLGRGGPRIQLMNQLGTIIRQLPASSFADPAGADTAPASHEALEARRSLFIEAMLSAQETEQAFDPDFGDPHEQRQQTALAQLAAHASGTSGASARQPAGGQAAPH